MLPESVMLDAGNKRYIRTYTGRKVDPLDLTIDNICLQDIAHALSNLCRYTGHTSEFYSVAQHCVLAAHKAPLDLALKALLHDASEAYLNDIARPVKHSPEFAPYRAIELRAQEVIFAAFDLEPGIPAKIHDIDLRLLRTEQRDLCPDDGYGVEMAYPMQIIPWTPRTAKQAFLQTFEEVRHYATTIQVAGREALPCGEVSGPPADAPALRGTLRGRLERFARRIARTLGVSE